MDFINYLFKPYLSYTNCQISLEIVAALTGIISVYFSINKNILVYPIGIVSTVLYTYLLYQWGLYGDMGINAYYTAMSIYGWWQWGRELLVDSSEPKNVLTNTRNKSQVKYFAFLILAFLLVLFIYLIKFKSFTLIPKINYIDSFITATFLVAMYLMAKKRIENWYFWILGNTLAIPLFIVKGYGITAFQYLVFLIMAFVGLRQWRKTPI